MAVSLGKRKTRDEADESDGSEGEEDLRARFQRAFEARFRPLDGSKRSKKIAEPVEVQLEEDGEENESDWEGLSDESEDYDEGSGKIEVIDHGTAMQKDEDEDRDYEKKAFMSSKPPSASTSKQRSQKTQAKDPSSSNDPTEATNMAHDIALQRLLKESHLLDPTTFSTSSATGSPSSSASATNPTGKSRLKALDLRLQGLGSTQAHEKMPMAMRKGIAAKAARREEKRRSEAKENGVVLERPSATSSSFKGRGTGAGTRSGIASRGGRGSKTGGPRGAVGAPGIGRMRGGTLTLSRKDVREIEGDRGMRKGRGGSRGKRGAKR